MCGKYNPFNYFNANQTIIPLMATTAPNAPKIYTININSVVDVVVVVVCCTSLSLLCTPFPFVILFFLAARDCSSRIIPVRGSAGLRV